MSPPGSPGGPPMVRMLANVTWWWPPTGSGARCGDSCFLMPAVCRQHQLAGSHPRHLSFADELAASRTRFAGWSPWIRDLIAATAAGQLMRHDVYHLPGGCPGYASGRVVLIGDAAHAMLPTIGEGAATALEDGVCVGRMIAASAAAGAELAAALAAFDQARRPRCRQLARQAILLARLGFEVGPGWRQAARNTVLRLLPAGTAFKPAPG
jgi:2-polyprenyl-6-methoxyphenol hydroxylase-like FAD-dependent oxidoreductase